MNNILSIDLDIVFSPYVGLYNNLVGDIYNVDYIWERISQIYDIKNFFPNEEYKKLIIDIINHYKTQVDTVYIGEDHSSILNALNEEKNNFKKPYKFNIYNIDFHHDIIYNDGDIVTIPLGLSSCANWIGFLNYFNFINSYTWWKSPQSTFKVFELTDKFRDFSPVNLKQYEFSNLFPTNLKIDMLYITFSAPWIPPKYYSVIQDILSNVDKDQIKYMPNFYTTTCVRKPFLSLNGDEVYNNIISFY